MDYSAIKATELNTPARTMAERTRDWAQSDLHHVITSARCIVWYAEVILKSNCEENTYAWNLNFYDEAAAERWLPIRKDDPTQSFLDAWRGAWHPDDVLPRRKACTDAFQLGHSGYSQEGRCILEDGSHRWVAEDAHVERLSPDCWRVIGVCTDITDRKSIEEEREQLLARALERANSDPLTGLLNHRTFHERFEEEASYALRNGVPLALAIVDIDNFKFFNDEYGHTVGDQVLCQVASALSACCRPEDALARYGGDEFAILMPEIGIADIADINERLSNCLDQIGYSPVGSSGVIPLGGSVGIAVYPDEGGNRIDVLNLADDRLLRSKLGGRESAELFEQALSLLCTDLAGFSILNALVTAVDNKDRYTRRHSEDVLTYSLQIAVQLGLDEEMQRQIQVAALLHDVGKIGVPDAVLRKPGKLTEEEYMAIKQHSMMGAMIVGSVPGFEYTLDAVRHHHERWDGQGYPMGLRGEAIPRLARLLAVADTYSAITTDRPYRKRMKPAEALAILKSGAGTQWDPACVAAFLRVYGTET